MALRVPVVTATSTGVNDDQGALLVGERDRISHADGETSPPSPHPAMAGERPRGMGDPDKEHHPPRVSLLGATCAGAAGATGGPSMLPKRYPVTVAARALTLRTATELTTLTLSSARSSRMSTCSGSTSA